MGTARVAFVLGLLCVGSAPRFPAAAIEADDAALVESGPRSAAATELFFPLAFHGRNPFAKTGSTDVTVVNRGKRPATVTISFLPHDSDNADPPSFEDVVPGRNSRVYEDFVATALAGETGRAAANAFGAALLTSDRPVVAVARHHLGDGTSFAQNGYVRRRTAGNQFVLPVLRKRSTSSVVLHNLSSEGAVEATVNYFDSSSNLVASESGVEIERNSNRILKIGELFPGTRDTADPSFVEISSAFELLAGVINVDRRSGAAMYAAGVGAVPGGGFGAPLRFPVFVSRTEGTLSPRRLGFVLELDGFALNLGTEPDAVTFDCVDLNGATLNSHLSLDPNTIGPFDPTVLFDDAEDQFVVSQLQPAACKLEGGSFMATVEANVASTSNLSVSSRGQLRAGSTFRTAYVGLTTQEATDKKGVVFGAVASPTRAVMLVVRNAGMSRAKARVILRDSDGKRLQRQKLRMPPEGPARLTYPEQAHGQGVVAEVKVVGNGGPVFFSLLEIGDDGEIVYVPGQTLK